MILIKELADFFRQIKKFVDVEFGDDRRMISYIDGYEKKGDKFYEYDILEFDQDHNILLDQTTREFMFLTTLKVQWYRSETNPNEGFLSGGFSFNSLDNLFQPESKFWKHYTERLAAIDGTTIDFANFNRLRWIESPDNDPRSETSPHYGCVEYSTDSFPNKFYFFDNGLYYKMTVQSYLDYVLALKASVAVKCWQYFYIDPRELIKKNKGLKYISWSIKGSKIDERLNGMQFDESLPYDRLDLIAEYLERCVRLLPVTFPFLDFEHHKNFYAEFSKLYKAYKGI